MKKESTPLGRRMHVSEGFRAFALDQLSQTCEVVTRSMFGGVGLYASDGFFGLLAGDVLYLRCDDQTRDRFVRAGSRPFKPFPHRSGTAHYYEVPLAVLEDVDELRRWVADALTVAARAGARPGTSTRKR